MLEKTTTSQGDYVDEPLRVSCARELEWHDSADVVIIGYGGAGVCAALEATDQGASVLAIDRFEGGGATALSGGVVYAGGGTRIQKANGFEDTPEEMFKYLKMEVGSAVSDCTLKDFCDSSVDAFNWLEKNNVRFDESQSPVKTSYPTDKYYYYYSGNEAVPEFAEVARPAPRGHRAFGPGLSGAAFYHPLRESAELKGVRTKLLTRASRLIMNENGVVIGVEVKRIVEKSRAEKRLRKYSSLVKKCRQYAPGIADYFRRKVRSIELDSENTITEFIRSNKGVIISAGGFIMNPEMVKAHAPKYQAALPLGDTGCDGVGIRLGNKSGGAIERMSRVSAWRFINPPLAWAKGIVVNARGERYCNEQVYGARLGYYMVEQNEGRAFLIINRRLLKAATLQSLPWRLWFFQSAPALMNMYLNSFKAKSIKELSENFGFDPSILRGTIEKYNAAANGECEDEFRKSADFMECLEDGPYYAMDISIDSKMFPCPAVTFGGLKVDESNGLVLRDDGTVIEGLYAAGRSAVGIASNHYQSGLSIADCIFSGRRAASHVVRQQSNV
jgi:3-oxo-5alpha-steroid 4-dehydrogenase